MLKSNINIVGGYYVYDISMHEEEESENDRLYGARWIWYYFLVLKVRVSWRVRARVLAHALFTLSHVWSSRTDDSLVNKKWLSRIFRGGSCVRLGVK